MHQIQLINHIFAYDKRVGVGVADTSGQSVHNDCHLHPFPNDTVKVVRVQIHFRYAE